MDKELQILNIDGQNYTISDKQARQDITTIKGKNIVTNVELNSSYADETKTLSISINVTKGTIGG